jgi:hypothetical protein
MKTRSSFNVVHQLGIKSPRNLYTCRRPALASGDFSMYMDRWVYLRNVMSLGIWTVFLYSVGRTVIGSAASYRASCKSNNWSAEGTIDSKKYDGVNY